MVAYSFRGRFVPRHVEGSKTQTIRADRPRHARPGEMVQLYRGMRTRACVKIVPDRLCIGADPVALRFDGKGELVSASIAGVPVADLPGFAFADGFDSPEDMARFWRQTHDFVGFWGAEFIFTGVLIRWVPVAGDDPGQLRTSNGQAVNAGPSVPPATGMQDTLHGVSSHPGSKVQ